MSLLIKLIESPWFWVDVVFSILGGGLVFWGLKMEKDATKEENPELFTVDERDRRIKAKRGWKILMTGIVIEVVAALGVSIISGFENAELNAKADEAAHLAGIANDRAATNELRAALVQSNNLSLQKEVLRLRNPAVVTEKQRREFIGILANTNNVSKAGIDVYAGKNDRQTEAFAFQIRKILNEAGYGSDIGRPAINTNRTWMQVTSGISKMELPEFRWDDVSIIKLLSGSVSPLSRKTVPNLSGIDSPGLELVTDYPFTESEPNVIAIFPNGVPKDGITPTVMTFYPTSLNPMRACHYAYAPAESEDAILYGVCDVLHHVGITVGITTNSGLFHPGRLAIFVPSR